jgi:hypothetical protein
MCLFRPSTTLSRLWLCLDEEGERLKEGNRPVMDVVTA